jgi:hypothetical protein
MNKTDDIRLPALPANILIVYRASKDFEKQYDPNFRPILIANDVDSLYKPAL